MDCWVAEGRGEENKDISVKSSRKQTNIYICGFSNRCLPERKKINACTVAEFLRKAAALAIYHYKDSNARETGQR